MYVCVRTECVCVSVCVLICVCARPCVCVCACAHTRVYLEALAVRAESDLLQPGLHLSRLPVGHGRQDAAWDFLSHEA